MLRSPSFPDGKVEYDRKEGWDSESIHKVALEWHSCMCNRRTSLQLALYFLEILLQDVSILLLRRLYLSRYYYADSRYLEIG